MIELGECEITAVFGPMASGKTYLIEQVWLPGQNRYVRFDSTGESMEDKGVEHVWKNPQKLYARLCKNPYYFRIAYHPGTNIKEDFYWVVKCLWRLDCYKLLVCDEFHEICSVNETPAFVQTMMRYARHNRLAVIGASQRIADVHKLFTSGSRKVIIFYSQEARDLGAVRDRWGSEAQEMVASCRPLLYDDRTRVTRQIPQCVVIEKGSPPKLYDFKTGSYVAGSSRPDDSGEDDSDVPSEGSVDNVPGGREEENVLPGSTGSNPDSESSERE
jgi:hypothetical protein